MYDSMMDDAWGAILKRAQRVAEGLRDRVHPRQGAFARPFGNKPRSWVESFQMRSDGLDEVRSHGGRDHDEDARA
jgi:hypothetical protein